MRSGVMPVVIAVCVIGCGSRERAARDDRGSGSAIASGSAAASGSADAGADAGGPTITFRPIAPSAGPAAAVRCSLAGDPLALECGRGGTIAVDGDGRIYATDHSSVRRFVVKAAAADRCELALDPTFATGGVLARPELEPAPQRLDGDQPVFMASGGPSWSVIAGAGSTMYYVEYLRGVHRIDRGTVEPVCPGLQGVRAIATVGKAAVISRSGGEKLVLGGACVPAPAGLEPAPTLVVGIRGEVWGSTQAGKVIKYGRDGTPAFTLGAEDAFGPGGMCYVAAIAPCGDDLVCVVDSNCKKLELFTADGTFVRERADDGLFATAPYGLHGGAGDAGGALWLAATHKDGEVCEGAIYRVAAP